MSASTRAWMRSSSFCAPWIWDANASRLLAGAFASLDLQGVDARAELVGVGVERLQGVDDVAQPRRARGRRSVCRRRGSGRRGGLGKIRRLRARVLESELQDFAGGLAVIGEVERLVGIADELRLDAEMSVPVDDVARDTRSRCARRAASRLAVDADAGLAAAAGCGAAAARATPGAATAPCDPVAGLCATRSRSRLLSQSHPQRGRTGWKSWKGSASRLSPIPAGEPKPNLTIALAIVRLPLSSPVPFAGRGRRASARGG